MSRNHWVILIVVVGVALAWWVVGLDPYPQPSETSAEPVPLPLAPNAAPAAQAPEPPAAASTPSAAPAPPTAANTEPTSAAKAPAEPAAEETPQMEPPERSGPVDDYKQKFASEPRASGGARLEATIEAQFRRPEVPADVLKSAICRTTVCRIETRWSPDSAQGFLSAVMRLVMDPSGTPTAFAQEVAIEPEGEPGPDGRRAINVYVKRAETPAAPPAQ